MYQVLSFTVFSFVSYRHIHMPLRMYWPRLFLWFSKKYSVYIILTMTMFVMSQSFISLPSFMFVSAVVSEIHDLNQNKKEKDDIIISVHSLSSQCTNRHLGHLIYNRVMYSYPPLYIKYPSALRCLLVRWDEWECTSKSSLQCLLVLWDDRVHSLA